MTDEYALETLAVRSGIERSQFGEHSEALYLTSSFIFENAAQAAARFGNQEPGNIYSRFTNPTVKVFEERLAALEGAECCVATSSGMSAILACVMGLLKAGDHVLCSAAVFGATVQLLGTIMKRFGLETTFVSGSDPAKWRAAVRSETRMVYVETPSNPTMEIYDIAAFSKLARSAGALLVVDNCFCTPILQQPLALGADVVIHSATEYLDGQRRVLGGAVLGKRDVINHVHFRNVTVRQPYVDYTEVWLDEGQVNMFEVMKELVRQKYSRSVLPEHPRAIDLDRERERGITGQYAKVGGGGFAGEIYNYGFTKAMLLAALS